MIAVVNFNSSQTMGIARVTSFARAKLYGRLNDCSRKFQFLTNMGVARVTRIAESNSLWAFKKVQS